MLAVIAVPCFVTLPWSLTRYDEQRSDQVEKILAPPSWAEPMGTDDLGRSLLWRSLLGGAISLGIGISAALIAVFIGVIWGAMAGYAGGKTDAAMMRTEQAPNPKPSIGCNIKWKAGNEPDYFKS